MPDKVITLDIGHAIQGLVYQVSGGGSVSGMYPLHAAVLTFKTAASHSCACPGGLGVRLPRLCGAWNLWHAHLAEGL